MSKPLVIKLTTHCKKSFKCRDLANTSLIKFGLNLSPIGLVFTPKLQNKFCKALTPFVKPSDGNAYPS